MLLSLVPLRSLPLFPSENTKSFRPICSNLGTEPEIWYHTDKTLHNIRMYSIISRYIRLLEGMHEIIIKSSDEKTVSKFRELSEDEYDKPTTAWNYNPGCCANKTDEDTHFLFEDTDFSFDTIKHLIKQGEQDAEDTLTDHQHNRK